MARNIGSEIPSEIISEIRKPLPSLEAIPLISIDNDGFPHVALLSYFEVFFQQGEIFFFVQSLSQSKRFLISAGRCTLVFVHSKFVYYVKGRACWKGDRESRSVFQLRVEAVLKDFPAPGEDDVFVKTAIRFWASKSSLKSRVQMRRRMESNFGRKFCSDATREEGN